MAENYDHQDHYDVLGFFKDEHPDRSKISPADIKKAYFRLARQHHSDQGGSFKTEAEREAADEKMKSLNAAYAVLGNEQKRAIYDSNERYRSEGYGSGQGQSESAGSSYDWSWYYQGQDFSSSYNQRNTREQVEEAIKEAAAKGEPADLSSFNLRYQDLSGIDLKGAIFSKDGKTANLKGAKFSGAHLSGCIFDGCDLDFTDFDHVIADGASFKKASLWGAQLNDSSFVKANFKKAKLDSVNFENANLTDAAFEGASMQYIKTKGATFSDKVNFQDCNLQGTDFSGRKFKGGNFRNANLYGAFLEHTDLSDADLTGANLQYALIKGVNLSNAVLKDAQLSQYSLEYHLNGSLAGSQWEGVKVFGYKGKQVEGGFTEKGTFMSANPTISERADVFQKEHQDAVHIGGGLAASLLGVFGLIKANKDYAKIEQERKEEGRSLSKGDKRDLKTRKVASWVMLVAGAAYAAKKGYDAMQR